MPAAPSSPLDPAIGQLLDLAATAGGDRGGFLEVLGRGVRQYLVPGLGLAVCAVLAGARSYVAIAAWAADNDPTTLTGLGVDGRVPSESTFRRTLQSLDADVFDQVLESWAARRTSPGPGQRRRVAVDGKTVRGSATRHTPGRHLLSALDHEHGVVLGQVEIETKTKESLSSQYFWTRSSCPGRS